MIKNLQQLQKNELTAKWLELFKNYPPNNVRQEFLIKYIAWELQAREKRALLPQAKKKLDKLILNFSKNLEIKEPTYKETPIKAGTKLIREFKGKKHEVTALDSGFNYGGEKYKSLSAIANKITGTRWNGKIFFGVKNG